MMNEAKYTVAVPPNVQAGDYFNVQLGPQNKVYTIRCPDGLGPGALVDIRVAVASTSAPVYTVHRAPDALPNPPSEAAMAAMLSSHVFVTASLFVLLTLAYALPRFAAQTVSSGCKAANPVDGSPIHALYFNLFRGLGSDQQCSGTSGNFCVRWSDLGAWGAIDHVAGSSHSHMQYDAQFGWQAAQVLVPLASALTAVAVLTLAVSSYYIGRHRISRSDVVAYVACCSSLVFLAWALSFSGLNGVLYSSTLSSTAWTAFFRAGYSFKDVLSDSTSGITPQPVDNSCTVVVSLMEGGILLSIATSVAFVAALVMCCIRCVTRD